MPLEYVTKRNGQRALVDWTKVDGRLNYLNSTPTQLSCNASFVADQVRELGGEDGMATSMLDERAAKVAANLASLNPDYDILCSRILVSNHQKNTLDCFSSTMEMCYRNKKTVGRGGSVRTVPAPRINSKLYKFTQLHKIALNRIIDYSLDYRFSTFGFSTLMDRYLLKRSGAKHLVEHRPQDFAIERPQDMWLRVACAIHMNRNNLADRSVLADIHETYDMLARGYIVHATPTLYNAGTMCEQLISCFIMGGEDSIEGIAKLKGDAMKLSKHAGGIGFWWPLRSAGSEVSTTNGTSDGPIPFLRGLEADMRATNQGGKRAGSAVNNEQPAHPDFMRWIKLRRNDEIDKVDKLFYACWIHDEFMNRVERDELWYFVDPHEHPELYAALGAEYSRIYRDIIARGEYVGEPVRARDVMMEVCTTQAKTGMPYMMFTDAVNSKSNQKNIGTIRATNLCTEVTEFSSSTEYACCAISSVCLPRFVIPCDCAARQYTYQHDVAVTDRTWQDRWRWIDGPVAGHQQGCNGTHRVDYDFMAYCTGTLTRNLNKINDINFYPVEETQRGHLRHRPLGIGVQGLADMFHILRYPFTAPTARRENRNTFETIYFGGVHASMELARRDGAYETFWGDAVNNPDNPNQPCPAAQGQLQFDMWGLDDKALMGRWPWAELKADIRAHGMRNSMITALPPTASTSNIQGNNECFEPYTYNIYMRNTLSGEYMMINHHLIRDLRSLGLWSPQMRAQLIAAQGSVQALNVPEWIKSQYRQVWELDNRDLIDMDADRAPFVDQSMSSNRYMAAPTAKKLFAMHLRCWRRGLKTGMYYLHSQSQSRATAFSEAARPKTTEPPTDEQNVICMLKKQNGVMCYTCQ